MMFSGVTAAAATVIARERRELEKQLYTAAGDGDTAEVQRCLLGGASPTARHGQDHRTPLHAAAAGDHVEVVKLLLEDKSVYVDTLDSRGCTPLNLACENGSCRVFELLLQQRGAHPNIGDSNGWRPLHTVSYSGTVEIAEQLLQLPQVQALVNARAAKSDTPLHLACRKGHSQVAKLLLSAGADLTARAQDGAVPMYGAVDGSHVTTVKVLLAAGADPAAVIMGTHTGLHVAAHYGYQGVLKQLLKGLAARPASSTTSTTTTSSSNSRSGAVDALSQGMTALHMAVEGLHLSCAEALVAAGASADVQYGVLAKDAKGRSLYSHSMLHRAVENGCAAMVRILATPGSVCRIWQGQTPLQLALSMGKAESGRALFAAGGFEGPPDSKAAVMTLAATSSSPGMAALLPPMVGKECERYKQLQQEAESKKQLQQGKGQRGPTQRQSAQQPKRQDPETLMAAVARAVSQLLRNMGAASAARLAEVGAACFGMALEVLGVAGAGKLLRLVMRNGRHAGDVEFDQKLLRAVHTGWLAAEGQTMRRRLKDMQRVQALQQQVADHAEQEGARYEALRGQAVAAAGAGEWVLFVEHLEQLTALRPAQATALLFDQINRQPDELDLLSPTEGLGSFERGAVLCEALLGSWRSTPAKADRQVAKVVLGLCKHGIS